MKIPAKAAAVFFAFILQSVFISDIRLFGATFNLALVALIAAALFSTPAEALCCGIFLGVLLDVLHGSIFGINTLLCMYTAVGCRALIEMMYGNDAKVFALFAFVFSFLYQLLFGAMSFLLWQYSMSWSAFAHMVVLSSLFNAILMIPVYHFFARKLRPAHGERRLRL